MNKTEAKAKVLLTIQNQYQKPNFKNISFRRRETPLSIGSLQISEKEEMSLDMAELLDCMKKHAISFRSPGEEPFILASGKPSFYYFDVKKVLFDNRCLNIIIKHLVKELGKTGFDAVGGMEFGAIPLVVGITMEMPRIKSFWVRKEKKEHGLRKQIEGNLDDGDKIVILDDVTTSGKSVIEAIDAIKQSRPNCKIVKVISVIDREEGAKDLIESQGIEFSALMKFSEIKPWVKNQLMEKYSPEEIEAIL